ncbi:MAG: hypothetical protein GF331_20270 [Chitinivibrionales bacterium]|nr:hypothetical protein [Chitinivibrionales bacterium]
MPTLLVGIRLPYRGERKWLSGFSVDTSVRIEAGDHDGMSRLVGYIARSPFALARMITRTDDGRIVYRASHPRCWSSPKSVSRP